MGGDAAVDGAVEDYSGGVAMWNVVIDVLDYYCESVSEA